MLFAYAKMQNLKYKPNLLIGFLLLTFGLGLLSSCGTVRYLDGEQRFLKKNKIYLKDARNIENKSELKSDLSRVYALRPNRKFMLIPRRYFYYRIQQKSDTTKINHWFLKHIAEPPAIVDTTLIMKTENNLKLLLAKKGYFDAEVTSKTKKRLRRRSIIKYYVSPNSQTKLDSAFLVCPDTVIYDLLMSRKQETFLKPGVPLSEKNYSAEVQRIVRLLRNKGYAKFNPSHIAQLAVDTTGQKTIARLEIYLEKNQPHKTYKIGNINIYHQYNFANQKQTQTDTIINDIKFMPISFEVKPKAIVPKVSIQRNELYNINDIEETQKLLSKLNFYRSVNIAQKTSSDDSTKIDINVFLSPKDKMSIGYLLEFNNSNIGSAGQAGSFLGMGGNINFAHRNIFGGSELLQLNLDAGMDISLKNAEINSSNFSLNGNVFFPKYINTIPFINLGKLLKYRRLDGFFKNVQKFSQSQFSGGFTYINIPTFYTYQLLKSNIGINYYGKNGSKLNVNNIGIDYFNPSPGPSFQKIIDNFPYLQRSFKKQLFTGFVFKNVSYFSSGIPNHRGSTFQWGGNFEVSGLEMLLINKTYNLLKKEDEVFRLGRGKNITDYSKFLKLELQTTLKQKLTSSQLIGAQFRVGAALPLVDTKSIPYVAQFYAGGPNSIRGWAIRELGPGGFQDAISSSPTYNQPYYQSGDIKIEMISEWRFDVFWIFKGAFFLDAGNVWTLKTDPDRPTGHFTKDFYKQIAIGTGFGLRMDLSFFILRVDMGLKMRNPFPNENDYYWLNYGGGFRKVSLGDDFNYNIQVGYPF